MWKLMIIYVIISVFLISFKEIDNFIWYQNQIKLTSKGRIE